MFYANKLFHVKYDITTQCTFMGLNISIHIYLHNIALLYIQYAYEVLLHVNAHKYWRADISN